MNTLPGWPVEASAFAGAVDHLMLAMLAMTGLVALAVIVVIVVFSLRYRHGTRVDRSRSHDERSIRTHRRIEIAWTFIPLGLFLAVFVWSAQLYERRYDAPRDAQQVFVVAKQWMWELQHADGRREINQLHVARGFPVRLVMTSQDVIHSFFIPAFRLKQDVLPGRYTALWFTPTRSGHFHLFCAEYCGTDHSRMGGEIIVMEPEDYQHWLATHAAGPSVAARGARLFRQFGCSGCHSDTSTVHAPSLTGLFGRPTPLEGGGMVIADERYIRDSVLLPRREIAAGYPSVMPSFAGQVSEDELLALVAYIESLADESAGNPPKQVLP